MTERLPVRKPRPVRVGRRIFTARLNAGVMREVGVAENGASRTRGLAAKHRAAWERLFSAYAVFYGVEQGAEQRQTVWSWLCNSANPLRGLVTVDTVGAPLGFVHFRSVPQTLRGNTGGFVDDLFVDPGARCRGFSAPRRRPDRPRGGLVCGLLANRRDQLARTEPVRSGRRTDCMRDLQDAALALDASPMAPRDGRRSADDSGQDAGSSGV